MTGPMVIQMSSEEIDLLRRQFENLSEVTLFEDDVEFSSKIASYGLFREIGTVNDELARFIFDTETKSPVRLASLKAELILWNGLFGIRIFSTDSQHLELRTRGAYDIVHPELSKNPDGSLHSLYIFPQIINKIAKNEKIDLVLVRSWGMNSIFGGFNPAKGYYQTNFWEIENNDALRFADLIQNGQLAFMGTHDLIAHIAGLDQAHWEDLKRHGQRVYRSIQDYFASTQRPHVAALILPYTIGVVLDDLAQPPSYSSPSHIAVLDELLLKLSKQEIPANLPTLLTQFPSSFQKIIEISRTSWLDFKPEVAKLTIHQLVQEIRKSSLMHPVSV